MRGTSVACIWVTCFLGALMAGQVFVIGPLLLILPIILIAWLIEWLQ